MSENRHWTNKPIPSLIISILGIGMLFFALLNLFELVDDPIEKSSSIGGIILGLVLMYPIFKSKKNKNGK